MYLTNRVKILEFWGIQKSNIFIDLEADADKNTPKIGLALRTDQKPHDFFIVNVHINYNIEHKVLKIILVKGEVWRINLLSSLKK